MCIYIMCVYIYIYIHVHILGNNSIYGLWHADVAMC